MSQAHTIQTHSAPNQEMKIVHCRQNVVKRDEISLEDDNINVAIITDGDIYCLQAFSHNFLTLAKGFEVKQ